MTKYGQQMTRNIKHSGIAYPVNVEPAFVDASLDADPDRASVSYCTILGWFTFGDLQNVA